MSRLLLVVAPALAAFLIVTPRSSRPRSAGYVRRSTLVRPVATAAFAAAALLPFIGVQSVLVAASAAGLLGAGSTVARRWRYRRDRRRRQLAVIDFCDALVAELRAGIPAVVALDRACSVSPDLAPIGAGARLGVDVPALMKDLGSRAGLEALRAVAAAWQVADRTGAGLASVIEGVGRGLRQDEDARAEIHAALGPPRATARMLSALPVLGLGLGESMGVHPTAFLVQTGLGRLCLATGVVLAAIGVGWVDRLAQAAEFDARRG